MQFYLSVFYFPTFPTVNLFFINHSFNEIAFSGSLTNQSAGDFNGLLEFHNFFIDSLSESPNIVIPFFLFPVHSSAILTVWTMDKSKNCGIQNIIRIIIMDSVWLVWGDNRQ